MTIDALIMLAGTLVALLPFLGFPNTWDDVIFFVLGVLVVALGIVVRRRKPTIHRVDQRKSSTVYSESTPTLSQGSAHETVGQ